MNLEKIISISGKSGLFTLKTQTRTGFIVESLMDSKLTTVSPQLGISMLTDISVFTYDGEVKLTEIFEIMLKKEAEGQIFVTSKDENTKLTAFFRDILPNFDESKVYISDIKKILNWYHFLREKKIIK